jgi:predicted small lipoprotein YifL
MKRKLLMVPVVLGMVTALAGCGDKAPAGEAVAEEKAVVEASADAEAIATEEKSVAENGLGDSLEDDSAAGNNSAESDANASDSASEASTAEKKETSPALLWEYEGYVDQCDGYTWQEEFFDCDYDGDGKNDRVYRHWIESSQTATYKIEFGNGDTLTTPEGWETGFPHIQSGDLDSDGEKEILVTFTYDTSTDPYSFGTLWLFDKESASGDYVEVELPLVQDEYGAKGFNVDYEKPVDNQIKLTVREAGLSMTQDVDDEYLSRWWSDDRTTEFRQIYYAEITDAGKPTLRCYFSAMFRSDPFLGFNLNYVNGKYEIGYIEIDTPDNWG